jgi:DNA primase
MDAVEDIKGRLNIEDVIAEYVELKRAGRNFKGLSPFTSEKSPSFMVSPEKQIWHDFSSGKGGNVFSFVMEMEGLDFKGALELLARKAGVDLSQYRSGRSDDYSKRKERLSAALELAAKFYQVQFSKHDQALEYIFKKRAFTKEIALQFRVGYSPNNGTALLDFMKGKQFTEDELKQAGLITQRYNRSTDMFRGRVMIPLMDPFGAVIGFTARLLDDDPNPSTGSGREAPKYINTPQTILYDKGRHVYGLHLAKEAIRKNNYAVLVEGNLDVIASHQAGIRQVIATAGTALTPNHLKSLSRLTTDIRLAFDQDKAGLSATERSIPIAGKENVSLSIITVPGHKDPDELIKEDPKLWEQAINDKQYALDWLIGRYKTLLDLTTAQGKREFSDVTLAVIRQLDDSVEQDHYIGRVADLIGVSREALRAKLSRKRQTAARPSKKAAAKPPAIDKREADQLKNQNKLLAICLLRPDLRQYLLPLKPEMLNGEPAQAVLTFLQSNPVPTDNLKLAPELQHFTDYVKILSLQFEELYQGLETLELQYEAARLQARLIEQHVKTRKSELAAAMREQDEAALPALLAEARRLDNLLKELTHPPKVL